jgi:hypothetical protein
MAAAVVSEEDATMRAMANHLDFLRALDDHVRGSNLGVVSRGIDLHTIATQAELVESGDQAAARWTGRLVDLGHFTHGLPNAGDRRPLPRGGWTPDDIQRFSDYVLTPAGHEEADRIRQLERQAATDAALGAVFPALIRPWMDATQQRALGEPLRGLRAALDDERHTAAIGAAKDLLEATCKVLLARAEQPASRTTSLPTLFREAHRAYTLDTNEPASDLGRSLATAVQRLADLRNAAGAGHGHAAPPALEARDARLAASAAVAAAAFLLTNVDLVNTRAA